MTAEYSLNLAPQTLENADPAARPLLEQAKNQLGFVPNMYAGMANAPGVLSTYLHGYQLFRESSGFTPPEQEVILLSISRFHGCEYCMGAHSMIAEKMSEVPADVLDALRNGREIPDPRLAELSRFTTVMLETRGLPNREAVDKFLAAGYQEQHVLQIILAIAVKTLSNYSNHVTHPELDDVFGDHLWNG